MKKLTRKVCKSLAAKSNEEDDTFMSFHDVVAGPSDRWR
jgi:hypothetical protein